MTTLPNLGGRRGNRDAQRQGQIDALAQLADDQRPAVRGTPEPRSLRDTVFQAAHGFAAKDPIYWTGTAWAKAAALDFALRRAIWVVESVRTNSFTAVHLGEIRRLTGLTPGAYYYVGTSGGLTTTPPIRAQPVLLALTTTKGVVLPTVPPAGGSGLVVVQAAHGFSALTAVRPNAGVWGLADALVSGAYAGDEARGTGVVEEVIDANTFRVVLDGPLRTAGDSFTAGTTYYLDPSTPGALTTTVPPVTGNTATRRGVLYAYGPRDAIVFPPVAASAHSHLLEHVQGFDPLDSDTYVAPRFFARGWPGKAALYSFQGACLSVVGAGDGASYSTSQIAFRLNAGTWELASTSNTQRGDLIGILVNHASGVLPLVLAGLTAAPASYAAPGVYYLTATPGVLSATPPAAPALRRAVIAVDGAGVNGMAFVINPQDQISKVEDLADVDITGRADGQVLTWDAADQRYENRAITASSFAAQTANLVLAGPTTGPAAVPTFRSLVPLDLGAGAGAAKIVVASSGTVMGWVAMSGDATMNSAGAITLASVIAAGGPIGSASVVPVITYDAKGRLTAVTTATITPAAIGAVDLVTYAGHTHGIAGDVGGTLGATVIGTGKVLATMLATDAVETAKIKAANVTYAKIQDVLARSVIGRSGATNGVAADISASADGQVLIRRSGALIFAAPTLDELSDVTIASRAANDVMVDNGTTYENKTPTAFASLLSLIRSKYPTGTSYAANGTHTFAAGSKVFAAIIIAGGAGGTGGTTGSLGGSGSAGGTGGGAGEVVYVFGSITTGTVAVTVGTGGAGGAAGATGLAGSNGGDSSIVYDGTTVTAEHGYLSGAGGATQPGTAEHLSWSVIRIPGGAGGIGAVTSVSFSGAGAVTGVNTSGGLGGQGAGSYGTGGAGGYGGSSAIAGYAGNAGRVIIFEG